MWTCLHDLLLRGCVKEGGDGGDGDGRFACQEGGLYLCMIAWRRTRGEEKKEALFLGTAATISICCCAHAMLKVANKMDREAIEPWEVRGDAP